MRTIRCLSIPVFCSLVLIACLAPSPAWSDPSPPLDQNKFYNNPPGNYVLYYTDFDEDWAHDPWEYLFYAPNPLATDDNPDMSCWIAVASNILAYEGYGNPYELFILAGAADSPMPSPWGENPLYANGGDPGDRFTFDDRGIIHWALEEGGMGSLAGPLLADWDSGRWDEDPIEWCQDRLGHDHPVGLGVYWGDVGDPRMGTWNRDRGGHAITLWSIDPVALTLTITDSDDIHIFPAGSRMWATSGEYSNSIRVGERSSLSTRLRRGMRNPGLRTGMRHRQPRRPTGGP